MTETGGNLATEVDRYLDGSVMSSQVVEIIGGMTLAADTSPSLEEGDDEVFYEEEATPFRKDGMPWCGQDGGRARNNTEVDEEASPVQENETGEDSLGSGLTLAHADEEMGSPQHSDEAPHLEHQTGSLLALDSAPDQAVGSSPALDSAPAQAAASPPALDSAPDQNGSQIITESLAEHKTQAEQLSLAEEGEQRQDVTSAQDQISPEDAEGPGQVNSEAEEDQESQDELDQEQTETKPTQDPLFVRATQSLERRSGHGNAHKNPFNHHLHSRYGTVSYRKIRRGNTREKIDEFETLMTNI